MEERMRKRRDFPPFGYWDPSNELPISQYFESARQAALHRSHSFRKEPRDVFELPPSSLLYHYPQRRVVEKRQQQLHEAMWDMDVSVKEQMKQKRVCDVSHATSQSLQMGRNPRAVDEDLYKIPPELLNRRKGTRRIALRGLWRKCKEFNCIYS